MIHLKNVKDIYTDLQGQQWQGKNLKRLWELRAKYIILRVLFPDGRIEMWSQRYTGSTPCLLTRGRNSLSLSPSLSQSLPPLFPQLPAWCVSPVFASHTCVHSCLQACIFWGFCQCFLHWWFMSCFPCFWFLNWKKKRTIFRSFDSDVLSFVVIEWCTDGTRTNKDSVYIYKCYCF